MGRWQRWQLAALGRYADATVISTESWRAPVAKLIPNRPVFHIPVGSNLPDERKGRSGLRESRGWTDETLVVATLGSDEASRLPDHLSKALNELAVRRSGVVLANLGVAPLELPDLSPRIVERRTGYASPAALAAELAAADMYLAPYEDGVSARRTTFVAALQHGLAVIGTEGRNTDEYLKAESGVSFSLAAKPDEFVRASVEIGTDAVRRGDYQRGARALFERRFKWSTIADSYLAALSNL
jgi:glycosyltransferase involved in cell wall biosynthesis